MKEEAMKSLKQYLAESEKTYKFRLRSINEISDEHMDKIESHMKKYNMESMSAFKKTIMQSKPRGFGDVGPNEVYISDMELKLPATPNIHLGIVDVRDVAKAHVDAILNQGSNNERFILCTSSFWLYEISQILF